MNNNVHSALSGTQTHKNLTEAFNGEARSFMRYRIFAKSAKENGDPVLARLLESISDNEGEHAELWLRYLGEEGSNADNLASLIASEDYETGVMYPEFSDTAKGEGFSEIADKMNFAANAEANHKKLLQDYLDNMRSGHMHDGGNEDTQWKCTLCGYIHTGNAAPERCPLCSYPRTYFTREN